LGHRTVTYVSETPPCAHAREGAFRVLLCLLCAYTASGERSEWGAARAVARPSKGDLNNVQAPPPGHVGAVNVAILGCLGGTLAKH
jgi:hypothetical protein